MKHASARTKFSITTGSTHEMSVQLPYAQHYYYSFFFNFRVLTEVKEGARESFIDREQRRERNKTFLSEKKNA